MFLANYAVSRLSEAVLRVASSVTLEMVPLVELVGFQKKLNNVLFLVWSFWIGRFVFDAVKDATDEQQ